MSVKRVVALIHETVLHRRFDVCRGSDLTGEWQHRTREKPSTTFEAGVPYHSFDNAPPSRRSCRSPSATPVQLLLRPPSSHTPELPSVFHMALRDNGVDDVEDTLLEYRRYAEP